MPHCLFNYLVSILVLMPFLSVGQDRENDAFIVFEDDFEALPSGLMSSDMGAHSEYHFIKELQPQGNWQIASFYHDSESTRAWKVMKYQGDRVIAQTTHYPHRFTHPMIISGDSLWENYTITLRLTPLDSAQCGLMFRYQNSRCYYFFGLKDQQAILKRVNHATGFRKPDEKILASKPHKYQYGDYIDLVVAVSGDKIVARIGDHLKFSIEDSTYQRGKVGLMADGPTYFENIIVKSTPHDAEAYQQRKTAYKKEEDSLVAANPEMVLWKKISTQGFGVGRNLRFGDMNGDGTIDVLIGQVKHHGVKDRNSELSCLTAMTLDGKKLWQIGTPNAWNDHLTNDVAFQIHDFDGDNKQEVIYCMNQELIVAEGATGKTKAKIPTPANPGKPGDFSKNNAFEHILGDCLYFADFQGRGRDENLVLKDRYQHYWVYDNQLNVLWKGECKTGHYPYAWDIDEDGKDELSIGYTLVDDDGEVLWSLDDQIEDHADGVALVRFMPEAPYRLLCAASDEGMFFTDMKGTILQHHYIGHVQNPAIANFRDDLPGLESVSINFWGNQGIITFYDSGGEIYHQFEPVQHGSMCLPVNWTGSGEEYVVLSANVEQGGLLDGHGRRVVRFPDDGHPDMCNAVLDLTGDAREEIVVWDPNELWVYTQSDNPTSAPIYQPNKNPLYNYSNYQTTVSLPE